MDLLDLAARQRWSSLAARAASHPEEIRLVDPSGLTPLHWCCFNRPPLTVIRSMLDNEPNVENDDNKILLPLVCLTDVHGTTPLHAACSSHASPEVIQALVDSHSPSILLQDGMGWTALHYLAGTAFASFSFSEMEGRDAIASVKILIQREPLCVECVDREGHTALSLLCEVMGSHHDPGWQFIRRRVRGNDAQNEAGRATAAISSLTLDQENAAEVTFCSLAQMMAEAMYVNWCSLHSVPCQEHEMPTSLHQMCVLFVPGDLIRYTLARHPEHARISRDIGKWKGQLPLHLALRFTPHNGTTIRNILLANRQAARVRDGDGMLPLQLALRAHRRWNNGAGSVLVAAPEALEVLGLDCSIYPFVLHKAMPQNSTKAEQLQAAFSILRSRPDLVLDDDGRQKVKPSKNQAS